MWSQYGNPQRFLMRGWAEWQRTAYKKVTCPSAESGAGYTSSRLTRALTRPNGKKSRRWGPEKEHSLKDPSGPRLSFKSHLRPAQAILATGPSGTKWRCPPRSNLETTSCPSVGTANKAPKSGHPVPTFKLFSTTLPHKPDFLLTPFRRRVIFP